MSLARPVPTDPLTIRALTGSSVQRRVAMAVLVGRVSPEAQQQAQGRGIVAGTGPVERRGLASVHIKAGMPLEQSLGPHQPSSRQVPPEASLSALPAGSGGHGTRGLRKKWEMAAVRAELVSISGMPPVSPFTSHLTSPARETRSPDDRLEGERRSWGPGSDSIFDVSFEENDT